MPKSDCMSIVGLYHRMFQSFPWRQSCRVLACALLLSFLSGCGLFDSSDNGKVHFSLDTASEPQKPNINPPAETTRILMELIQESAAPAEESDGSENNAEDSAEKRNSAVLASVANGEGSAEASSSSESDDDEGGSSDSDESGDDEGGSSGNIETTCKLYPASYSKSVDYSSGDSVDITIEDVAAGAWVMRVSAMDANSKVLAYVQKGVTVDGGSTVDVSGSFNSGAAPEGYIFLASPTGNHIVRLSLYTEELQNLYTNNYAPAILFSPMGQREGRVGDTLYAITGGTDLLEMTLGLVDTSVNVVSNYIPGNCSYASSSDKAVISYYSENGVYFYPYDTKKYTGPLYTGRGASAFSNPVNGQVWVTNEVSENISQVDIASEKCVGTNISQGYVAHKLAVNDAGTRIWSVCRKSVPCVHAVTTSGSLIGHYTEQISDPSDIVIVNGLVCVAEANRGEVVFFQEDSKCDELERIVIKEGVADQMVSDGQRLYVLTPKKSLAVVDLTTRAYNRTIPVSGDCSSMMWVH